MSSFSSVPSWPAWKFALTVDYFGSCSQSFSESSLHLRLTLNTRLDMVWSSLAHPSTYWLTASSLRKTGTSEYCGQLVHTCPLCFSQAEHLKCLAKETSAFNAIPYFRLIGNILWDAEILKKLHSNTASLDVFALSSHRTGTDSSLCMLPTPWSRAQADNYSNDFFFPPSEQRVSIQDEINPGRDVSTSFGFRTNGFGSIQKSNEVNATLQCELN